jgi:DNA gyrase inhibitor GyrI
LGEEPCDAVAYEIYVDNPDQVPPDKLRTDIYIPLM